MTPRRLLVSLAAVCAVPVFAQDRADIERT